jgi:hypothetical protein
MDGNSYDFVGQSRQPRVILDQIEQIDDVLTPTHTH